MSKLFLAIPLLFITLLFSACIPDSPSINYEVDTTTIDPGQQMGETDAKWYQSAVFYHIWVKAFSDGVYKDGIGDIRGIINNLDYLNDNNDTTSTDLGINAIWLSPIFECAYKGDNMHGYDTTDYYAINNRFGKNEDVVDLLNEAHARGIKVIFDFVPNHTSNLHPWVSENIDLYKHSSTVVDWPSAWSTYDNSKDVTTWFKQGSSWVYSAFQVNSLYDLNYMYNDGSPNLNPYPVRVRMEAVLNYWLDRGFDGARFDAVRYIVENGSGKQADQPETHAVLQEFRSKIEGYASKKMMVAEAWMEQSGIANYYGNGTNEFNMCFDFPGAYVINNTIKNTSASEYTNHWSELKSTYPSGYVSATFTANHDNVVSRAATLYGGNRKQCILSAALNILSFGTPFIYYGEEVGMTGAAGDDINLRQPMAWKSVTAQSGSAQSILSWYRYLIRARLGNTSLREGGFLVPTSSNSSVLAYVKDYGSQYTLVVANLSSSTVSATISSLPVQSGSAVNIIGKNQVAIANYQIAIDNLPAYAVRVIQLSTSVSEDSALGIFASDLQ